MGDIAGVLGLDLLGLEPEAPIRPRRRHIPRNRDQCPLDVYDQEGVRRRYRLYPNVIAWLATILVFPTGTKNGALTPTQRVLVALRFLATGTFYVSVGDCWPLLVSPSTACRCIWMFVDALWQAQQTYKFISFPKDLQSLQTVKQAFYDIAGN